ncbi:DNA polymerase III subunit alpha [Saprospiraceae bacterium]|nr:DNA polymerase III subunit alpha [Saprospiraceae bacterium]
MFLNNHTYYSLRYGTLSPEELVQWAISQKCSTLVLTDINNTSCTFDFIRRCKAAGIKPIVGVEFRSNGKYYYTAIAKNKEGFREICELLTKASFNHDSVPRVAPLFKNCYVIYRHLPKPPSELLEHEYVGVRPQEVNRLFRSDFLAYKNKLVVFNPIAFDGDLSFVVHKLLRSIDLNVMLSQLRPDDHATQYDRPLQEELIVDVFSQYPEIIENTQYILDTCEADMESSYLNNRRTFTGSAEDDYALLEKLAFNGCNARFGENNEAAFARTKKELNLILEMGFCSYFLITWDIIRYARSAGYHHVGRGSGANSIVAYNLYITDVDPLELDLYFERFINPHRLTPPDFDIDFSWNDRDDVTDYIFKRYGRAHTALLATYNTFKGKSIIRELGKVFGLSKAEIDTIIRYPNDRERQHPLSDKIFGYGKLIENFPNYLSIHAGGILISEEPLNNYTALQMMPKGFPITHFDMYAAEDLQFHKYDVLSQRGLGHIRDAVNIIRQNRAKAVDIHDVAKIKEDPKAKELLQSGQCTGCFYIESPAMRGLLSKLKCENYTQLVAASSIIRPGVAKSGMMKTYIERAHDPSLVKYLHPIFEEHLKETNGVMVYQEDVMKIVHHFAGLDLAESDILRRIMTGKKKNQKIFQQLKTKFFRNCEERNYPESLVLEVWRQIASFSGYSFCKAHSASFAVESYQSMFLKAYFPLEFMVAVINNFGGFYSTEHYIHEARMLGGTIEAPCVNRSSKLTNISGTIIHLGFIHIGMITKETIHRILIERSENGDYRSLGDFVHRVHITSDQLMILIRIGAFRFTGMMKSELIWEQLTIHGPKLQIEDATSELFISEADVQYKPEIHRQSLHEKAFDEIEFLGFPLCSPFDLLSTDFRGDMKARQLKEFVGKTVTLVGYYVIKKDVTTVKGRHMNFGAWIDEDGNYFDTIHFPPCLEKYPFEGSGCYKIKGTIVEDFGFPSLEVIEMEKLAIATKEMLEVA